MKYSKHSVELSIEKNEGFSLSLSMNDQELQFLRNNIYEQWLYRIQLVSPKIAARIFKEKISMDDYHLISDDLDHSTIWPKLSRVLSFSFFKDFSKTIFYKDLGKIFGSFEISDEENLGWPNLYWRITRPNSPNDIGPLHRDSWFWELNNSYKKPKYSFKRIKVWIPVYTIIGQNGLLVEPHSQKRMDIRWSSRKLHGINKPNLEMAKDQLSPILLNVASGNAVIFNDNLIHGGALNCSSKTRVSLEFTMLVKT